MAGTLHGALICSLRCRTILDLATPYLSLVESVVLDIHNAVQLVVEGFTACVNGTLPMTTVLRKGRTLNDAFVYFKVAALRPPPAGRQNTVLLEYTLILSSFAALDADAAAPYTVCLVHIRNVVIDMAFVTLTACRYTAQLAILDRDGEAVTMMSAVAQLHPFYVNVYDRLRKYHFVTIEYSQQSLVQSVLQLVMHWDRARRTTMHRNAKSGYSLSSGKVLNPV